MSNNANKDEASPSQLHAQAIQLMTEFADQQSSEFVSNLVEKFSKVTRAFSQPTYLSQDTGSAQHRRGDLVGGFPYTNEEHPWPKTPGNDLYMQPIVQLNLANAGSILGADLGTATLQVWGPVAEKINDLSTDIDDFCIRLIPEGQMVIAPSDFFPDWRMLKKGIPTAVFHMQFDQDAVTATMPRVKWSEPLQMFGSKQHLLQLAWADLRKESEDFGDDELIDLADQFMDYLDASPLSAGSNTDYLGGFGGQTGGEYDPSYGENLLLRITDGNGFYFAIKWMMTGKKGLVFEPSLAIRV